MRRLFARIRLDAPFLYSERGALSLTRELASVGGGASEFGPDDRHVGLELVGEHGARSRELLRCRGTGASFAAMELDEATVSRSQFRRSTWSGCLAAGSSWDVVDLEGARLSEFAAPGARFALCSFRDAVLAGAKLSGTTFVLCDFSGADLSGVDLRGARLVGCDFEDAVLQGVDLDGADLGASSFRRALFLGGSQAVADASAADLRDAAGLSDASAAALTAGGARTGGGRLYALWARALGATDAAGHRRVLRAVATTWAAVAILVPALFFGRAILDPVDPDAPPGTDEITEDEPVDPG